MTDDLPEAGDAALAAALDELFAPQSRSDAPGLVVGLRWQGRLLYRRGFGLTCVAQGGALTPATRLRIGSASKQFCCWALLLLADEGRLDLDQPLRTLLPELQPASGRLTPRQLMQHTGGLRCHLDLWTLASAMRAPLRDEEQWALLLRQRGTNFAPGERLVYSNGGYWLLSELVRRLAGQPLGEFLQRRLFAPLGLHDTVLLPRDGVLLPRLASQHVRQPDGGWRRGELPLAFAGDGGLVSTLDDMLRWLAYLDSDAARPFYERLQQRVRLAAGGGPPVEGDYGLGLCLRPYRGRLLVGHAGAVLGGHAELLKVAGEALDLVLIANRSDLGLGELARRAIDTVLGPRLAPPRPRARAATLAGRAGHYRACSDGQVLQLCVAEDQAQIDFGGIKAPLYACDDGPGWLFAGALGDLVLRPQDDRHDGLRLLDHGREDWLEFLPPAAPAAAAAWTAGLAGDYASDELPATLRVVEQQGRLTAELQGALGRARYRLQPLAPGLCSAHEADGEMAYSFTLQARPGGLRLSSLRTRRLDFERIAATPVVGAAAPAA